MLFSGEKYNSPSKIPYNQTKAIKIHNINSFKNQQFIFYYCVEKFIFQKYPTEHNIQQIFI